VTVASQAVAHKSVTRPSGLLALSGLGLLASVDILWQLGSSSFFIDEISSMKLAASPLSQLLTKLKVAENSPAGYFAILHFWTKLTGSNTEWVARLPSAIAGIALVFAVYRLGVLVADARVGLLAGLLAAVSPLVLQYAEQARPYAIAMLAVTIGAIGALEATRQNSWAWLIVGCVAFSAALSMHYASLAVAVPFCVWMLWQRATPFRMRLVFCGVIALAWLAWLPLLIAQHNDHPGEQLGQYGTLTAGHLVRVVAAPFDDRYTLHPGILKAIAAAVVGIAIAGVARYAWRAKRDELLLMSAVFVLSIVGLLGAAAAGVDILNSRYMTFVLPFTAILLATGIANAPRTLSIAAVSILLVTAVIFDLGSHRREHFYPDVRGAVDAIAVAWRPGDAVQQYSSFGVNFPLLWYAGTRLRGVQIIAAGSAAAQRSLVGHARVWIVREEPRLPGTGAGTPPGYHTIAVRKFASAPSVSVELASANRSR